MKWENDPFRQEKQNTFDRLLETLQHWPEELQARISIRMIFDGIDKLFAELLDEKK